MEDPIKPVAMDAETFAAGIKSMSFMDVQRIVDAINSTRSARSAVDGMTLMRAADLILDPRVPPAADVALHKPKVAAEKAG